MSFQEKILSSLIRFFGGIHTKSGNILHELKFLKYEMDFGERDEDIYVATYLKSGTTWMQAILYQLTTAGEMNFNHLYDVSPWLRNLAETGQPILDLPSPRIIKTHDAYHRFKAGKRGKFIYVVRAGWDVGLSLYHHQKNYNNNSLAWEDNFVSTFVTAGDKNWFEFNAQWLANKNKLPILYVRYEDLQNNFVPELNRIAAFIGTKMKDEDLPRIIERTSFQFMKKNESKFGEQPQHIKHSVIYDQFIRSGKIGEGKLQFTPEQMSYFIGRFTQNLSSFPIMNYYKEEINAIANSKEKRK